MSKHQGHQPVTPPLDPFIVAYFMVENAESNRQNRKLLSLLKLVYIAHGWHLGIRERPLIKEPVEAWQHGPVVRSIYVEVRDTQSLHVAGAGKASHDTPHKLSDADAVKRLVRAKDLPVDCVDDGTVDFIKSVYDMYKGFTAWMLREITHDAPWTITFKQGEKTRIPEMSIQAHYQGLYMKRQAFKNS